MVHFLKLLFPPSPGFSVGFSRFSNIFFLVLPLMKIKLCKRIFWDQDGEVVEVVVPHWLSGLVVHFYSSESRPIFREHSLESIPWLDRFFQRSLKHPQMHHS